MWILLSLRLIIWKRSSCVWNLTYILGISPRVWWMWDITLLFFGKHQWFWAAWSGKGIGIRKKPDWQVARQELNKSICCTLETSRKQKTSNTVWGTKMAPAFDPLQLHSPWPFSSANQSPSHILHNTLFKSCLLRVGCLDLFEFIAFRIFLMVPWIETQPKLCWVRFYLFYEKNKKKGLGWKSIVGSGHLGVWSMDRLRWAYGSIHWTTQPIFKIFLFNSSLILL